MSPVTARVVAMVFLLLVVSPAAVAGRATRASPGEAAGGLRLEPGPAHEARIRIQVRERGIYRLTYADLHGAGLPVETLDPAALSISVRGQPVAIEVEGEEDGRFDPGDRVIFYGEPYIDRYVAENVYRLELNSDRAGDRAGRQEAPAGEAVIALDTVTRTLHIEVDAAYRGDYPLPTDVDHFFDTPLYTSAAAPSVARSYDLALWHPSLTGQVAFRGLFYGGKDQPASPDESVLLGLNGRDVTTFRWDGRQAHIATAVLPAAWLDATPNRLTLTASLAQLPGLAEYWVYPDWLELSYAAEARAENDRLWVEGLAVPPGIGKMAESMELRASGFSTPHLVIFDVRRPREPVRIEGAGLVAEATGFGVRFAISSQPAELPQYYLSTDEALLAPAAIEPEIPSDLRAPRDADLIAIVHASLAGALEPLLQHRRAEGTRAVAVDVQDIYDEFSYGYFHPPAIREFLRSAYLTWNPGGPRPRYVLLAGDGHYDFKNATGTQMRNLVPPFLAYIDPFSGETAADNRFACFDGPYDNMPEMAVGRIPANSPDELRAVVAKVLAYEDEAQTPAGEWQRRAVFTADGAADPSGNFHLLTDEVREEWLPAGPDEQPLYYGSSPALDTGLEMREAIRQAFDQGAFYLQWYGHANAVRWGRASVFDYTDPPRLITNGALPFTAHFSCWSGYFIAPNNPFGTGQALGEVLVLQPGRGSIADLSPSGQHAGSALLALNEALVLAIFRDRNRRVGDAVDAAKGYFAGSGAPWPDLIDTSILFGDPATRLRLPISPPSPPGLSISLAGNRVSLSWRHAGDASFYETWRSIEPSLEAGALSATFEARVEAGHAGRNTALELPVRCESPACYFLVIARNGDGASPPSNRTGIFTYTLSGEQP